MCFCPRVYHHTAQYTLIDEPLPQWTYSGVLVEVAGPIPRRISTIAVNRPSGLFLSPFSQLHQLKCPIVNRFANPTHQSDRLELCEQSCAFRILNRNRKAVHLVLNLDHVEEISVSVVREDGFIAAADNHFQVVAHGAFIPSLRGRPPPGFPDERILRGRTCELLPPGYPNRLHLAV